MFSDFLKQNTTYQTELRDFYSWHKGIKYFGFWAIEVSSLSCQDEIQKYQEYFSSKLHPNYSRQPHITLFASGLLSENYCSESLIQSQLEHLKQSNIKSFPLHLINCNSFATCPYLSVFDPLKKLNEIRSYLNNENNTVPFTPHVTLGFYNKAYNTTAIVEDISKLEVSDIKFMVREVVFAQYLTKDIQGPYEVLHRIILDK